MNTSIETYLSLIYEEIMWLAKRPNNTPSDARSWYTHVISNKIKKQIRQFSGLVSEQAIREENSKLRLEHFKRIQATLTQLVDCHLKNRILDSEEFVRVVLDCEQVHIVTTNENYAAMQADGDYQKAGILLVEWSSIPPKRRISLWENKLRGNVANDCDYAPNRFSV